jgi:hypothetical protein
MCRYMISLLCERHGVYLHKPWSLALTWPPYTCKSFQASISRIGRFHRYWIFALASNFPPQSAYLEFPKFLTTVVYAVQRLKRHYVAHNCNYVIWDVTPCSISWIPSHYAPLKNVSIYQGADKSLARPTTLSIVFSVQGTGGSPTGPDPENRVGDEDIGSPGRPVSSGLQVPGEPFPSWSG